MASVALAGMAGNASAATVQLGTYTGANGTHEASASFSTDGTSLFVTLTDTGSAADVSSIADLLTGMVFDLNGVTLGAGHASTTTEANVHFTNPDTITTFAVAGSNNLDSNWGGGALTGNYQGFVAGDFWLTGVGLGVPGGGHAFDGTNLGGGNYSIIPNGTVTSANGNGLPNQSPFVFETLTASFLITSGDINTAVFGNAKFLFGTQPETVTVDIPFTPPTGSPPPGTPLPAAAWSGMALIGGLGVLRKMRRKA
jgi:hypothetical protein